MALIEHKVASASSAVYYQEGIIKQQVALAGLKEGLAAWTRIRDNEAYNMRRRKR
jgi:hypothetical protein